MELLPDGSCVIPAVDMFGWYNSAAKFATSLDLKFVEVLQLMHPEDSILCDDTPWIVLVVESNQHQQWPTLLVPLWGGLSSDAVSVDLSLQTIAAKVQTSTSFLVEPAEDAALSAEEDRISKEELHAAFLCQYLDADVFRTVRSWAFQGSLLKMYWPGSCKGSRMIRGINMSSREAAMYTVSVIRRRLNSAAKGPKLCLHRLQFSCLWSLTAVSRFSKARYWFD